VLTRVLWVLELPLVVVVVVVRRAAAGVERVVVVLKRVVHFEGHGPAPVHDPRQARQAAARGEGLQREGLRPRRSPGPTRREGRRRRRVCSHC